MVAGAVTVLSQRSADAPVAEPPPVEVPAPPTIDVAAVLPTSFGDPVSLYAIGGGQPQGTVHPRVDIWSAGTTRIVVRTFPEPGSVPDLSGSPTTVAAPAVTEAPDPNLTSTVGDIEQLASDQWVKYFSAERNQGNTVIIRGADSADAEAMFDSLVDIDGVLAPPAGFELVEHADAVPASELSGWYTLVGYGAGSGELFVSAWEPDPGRESLELATAWSVGAIRTVAGREVFDDHAYVGREALMWLDPSGAVVGVYGDSTALDDSIVSQVSLVPQRQLEALAGELSARLASRPVMAAAEVDGLNLTLRGTTGDVVLCIGTGAAEQCAADQNASINAPPLAGTNDTIVDGEWIVFGYFELGVDQYMPDVSDDRFVTPEGETLPVTSVEQDGFLWYAIRVPTAARTLTVDASNDVGGIVGTAARPLVIGPLG
jgi:hypothetical protein